MNEFEKEETVITFTVNSDVYRRFQIALQLSGDTSDEAANACVRWYIAKTFGEAARESAAEAPGKAEPAAKDNYGKAKWKIPLWAMKPDQYNHKIIRAYFIAVETTGEARLSTMELLCSDRGRPDLYVPKYKSNYASMKTDSSNSHGKVFEDDGDRVWIWDEVEETLIRYKSFFYPGE